MQSFARVTKLPNIKGRGKYISDVRKQEEILAQSAPVDWTPPHDATKWYISAPLRGSLFAAFPPSCRLVPTARPLGNLLRR